MPRKKDMAGRVAEQAAATLVYVDKDLRVRFANRHCHELLGRAPDELHGRDLAELVDTATMRFARRHVAEVEKGRSTPREYALRHKDGSKKFVQVTAVPDRDPAGRSIGYVLSTFDNAGPRAAAAEVAAANHALRTPLASVIAALELLHDNALSLSGGTPEALLALALENAERLAVVVEQLLDLERIDSGATVMEVVPIELEALVAAVVKEISRPGAACVRFASAGQGLRIAGDPARLRQGVLHLIGGAIHRSRAGGTVAVGLTARRDRVFLTVQDEAPQAASGSDLGLLIAEAIVKRSDGALRLEQRSGQGTLVVVDLPRLKEQGRA